MNKVQITAIRQTVYPDLIAQYENPIEHTCDIRQGQQWTSINGKRPEGLCLSAWESMRPFVESLAQGKGNFYDGWMKNPMSAMISCNDGFRPFSFYIEVIDEQMSATPEIERHPLRPFLPPNAQLLMLGSFPPPKERWCMDFFYPNPQNDMWRIMGQIFFGDKTHFEGQRDDVQCTKAGKKVFNREEIVSFCETNGIAIFDTAQAVIRLQGNAADEHLEIVEPTDIAALLQQIPLCHNICCTGGKAAQTLAETLHCVLPKVGEFIETNFAGRTIRFWRMPSSSRAYPLSLDKKAAAYRRMFEQIGLL